MKLSPHQNGRLSPERCIRANSLRRPGGTLDEKLWAMREYGSELHELPRLRSIESVSNRARSRGLEVGVEAAEAFQLIRQIL